MTKTWRLDVVGAGHALLRLATFGLATGALVASGSALAVDCIVVCTSATGCSAQDAASGALLGFTPNQLRRLPNCVTTTMREREGSRTGVPFAEGVYQGPRGVVHFVVADADKPLGKIAVGLGNARCGISGLCQDDRERRRRVDPGGMGADEVKFVHEGNPCSAGLPCGRILKPYSTLGVQIVGAGETTLLLTGVRGAGTSTAYPVRAGRVEIPADVLTPGAVYRYALQGGAGGVALAGEFSVISARMQKDIEDAIVDESRKSPETAAFAAVRVLIEEDLLWDANRRVE